MGEHSHSSHSRKRRSKVLSTIIKPWQMAALSKIPTPPSSPGLEAPADKAASFGSMDTGSRESDAASGAAWEAEAFVRQETRTEQAVARELPPIPPQAKAAAPPFKFPAPTVAAEDQPGPGERWIKLPEALFSSIMSVTPEINQLYEQSKALSDDWLKREMKMDDKTAKTWAKLDISYMSAICAPHADLETLKLMNDWNGWVFGFDDPFDEGGYNPKNAAEEIILTLALLDHVHPTVSADENPLRHTLQSCWERFQARASAGLQYRWKRQLTAYCLGVLAQVDLQHRGVRPTVDEYMDMRASCVGALPCVGLMEYAEGIDLPLEVVDHPSLKQIVRVTCDLVTLQNDLLSYRKDLLKGEDSNILFILKDGGLSDQQATDRVGDMLGDCYRRWYAALRDMPFWGAKIDRDVLKYIEGCRNLALGNLHWSFYTPRYLGNDSEEIKRTGIMKLPLQP